MRKLVILAAMALMICVGSVEAQAHPKGQAPCDIAKGKRVAYHITCAKGHASNAVNHKHTCTPCTKDKITKHCTNTGKLTKKTC